MKFTLVKSLKVGDVLFRDVVGEDGTLILNKGTILGTFHIAVLLQNNIRGVDICSTEKEVSVISIENYTITRTGRSISSVAHRYVNEVLRDEQVASLFYNSSEHVKGHSYNVALYVAMLLQDRTKAILGDGREIIKGALLHDIGKNYIPTDIIYAPRRLTDIEFDVVKLHTLAGHSVLCNEGFSAIVRNIALYHHETFTGNGYPHSVDLKDIPWYVDLVHICDIYDALCSKRIYKDSRLRTDARKIIEDQRDIFRPEVYDLFMNNMPSYFIGDTIVANNRLYEVIGYNDNYVPVIREVLSHEDHLLTDLNCEIFPINNSTLKEGE